VASGVLLGLTAARGADNDPGTVFDSIQQSVQAVFEKSRGAVVRIQGIDFHGPLSGTGFFIDPFGTIFTCYSVGGETQFLTVTVGNHRYPAHRLVSDLRSGVAILKIDADALGADTPFLPFGNSRKLGVAAPVIAVGFPMDLPLTPAFGTVGGFDHQFQGHYFATSHIRANIPVQRGEGGAPLLNPKGEVVGILMSRVDAGSASFVLPIEAAEKIRKDYVRFHDVRPGWIGVQVKSMETPVSGSRAQITEVISNGPAEKAGLKGGDVVLRVGDVGVQCLEDMIDASFFLSPEGEVNVRVARDGSERDFPVMPIDHPDFARPHPPVPTLEPGLEQTVSPPAPFLKIAP
jgi:serine protease Do